MAIDGLVRFLEDNHLLDKEYKLKDTVLIIDGTSLLRQLYLKLSLGTDNRTLSNYPQYTRQVHDFFRRLLQANIRPLVLLEGTLQVTGDSLQARVQHFGESVNHFPPLLDTLFQGVLATLQIPVFRALYDVLCATVIQMAHDLGAPILASSTTDLLLHSTPQGVILLDSLLQQLPDATTFLECTHFHISRLESFFPKFSLNPNLFQLANFILSGNPEADVLLRRIPLKMYRRSFDWSQERIFSVLYWTTLFKDADMILDEVHKLAYTEPKLVRRIEAGFVKLIVDTEQLYKGFPLRPYVERKKELLFPQKKGKDTGVSSEIIDRYIRAQIDPRCFSILYFKVDFQPIKISTLLPRIYAILRSDPQASKPIRLFLGSGSASSTGTIRQLIWPEVFLSGDDDFLPIIPMLSEIEQMNEKQRINWFWRILGMNPIVGDELERLLPKEFTVDQELVREFVTMSVALVYMFKEFQEEIHIETVMAILLNIVLAGYFNPKLSLPNFAHLEPILEALTTSPGLALSPANHELFLTFQVMLSNVSFLAQLLNLSSLFSATQLVSVLHGPFLYGATMLMSSSANPFTLIEHLFPLCTPVGSFYRKALNCLLKQSSRRILIRSQLTGYYLDKKVNMRHF